jgi:hypothetical protein
MWPSWPIGTNDGCDGRCAEGRVDLLEQRRQQAVARHRVEDARLRHDHHENDAGESCNRTDLDEWPQPGQTGCVDRIGDRGGPRDRIFQVGIIDDSSQHASHGDV